MQLPRRRNVIKNLSVNVRGIVKGVTYWMKYDFQYEKWFRLETNWVESDPPDRWEYGDK